MSPRHHTCQNMSPLLGINLLILLSDTTTKSSSTVILQLIMGAITGPERQGDQGFAPTSPRRHVYLLGINLPVLVSDITTNRSLYNGGGNIATAHFTPAP